MRLLLATMVAALPLVCACNSAPSWRSARATCGSCVGPQGEFTSSTVSWIVAEDCAANGLRCGMRAGEAVCS